MNNVYISFTYIAKPPFPLKEKKLKLEMLARKKRFPNR